MRLTGISLLAAMLLTVPGVFGQTYAGSISGRVLDNSGLPVPKAAVTVTEESTNTALKTLTSDSEDYIVDYLKPGSYTAQFAAPGFKNYMETGILLQINQERRVDPTLEVGQVTETVKVTASSAQVNYVSPEIGQVVDAQQLVDLPELASAGRGRSPFLLSKILPGVSSSSNVYTNINSFSFAGRRQVTNEILVDGLPTTNPSDETYADPGPDSIQEFRVLTPFSAEYGHTGGGVMMATTRGGTNALHGSAYDLFRNRLLNGRDFFQPAQSTVKYVQNDPGHDRRPHLHPARLRRQEQDVLLRRFQRDALASTGGAYSGSWCRRICSGTATFRRPSPADSWCRFTIPLRRTWGRTEKPPSIVHFSGNVIPRRTSIRWGRRL